MAHPEHRGFSFHSDSSSDHAPTHQVLRATRGRITLTVEGSEQEMPPGWELADVLRYEIDRLMDPAALRHVEHLN